MLTFTAVYYVYYINIYRGDKAFLYSQLRCYIKMLRERTWLELSSRTSTFAIISMDYVGSVLHDLFGLYSCASSFESFIYCTHVHRTAASSSAIPFWERNNNLYTQQWQKQQWNECWLSRSIIICACSPVNFIIRCCRSCCFVRANIQHQLEPLYDGNERVLFHIL